MSNQLSADDWLGEGLKTLAKSGFTALKADTMSKALGVSRGSFYWHFADVAAFQAAVLERWRDVAAEQVIADLESIRHTQDALAVLLGRAFSGRLTLERAVRHWAAVDRNALAAVQSIDQRRVHYIENLLRQSGQSDGIARARAQILYWAYIGQAVSHQPLPKGQQKTLRDELLRMARA